MFDPSVFWPEFKSAGMLSTATDADGDFDVGFAMPGQPKLNGSGWSNEYEIEYQTADRPNLAEGDALSIVDPDGNALGDFRVRAKPYVSAPGNAADGTFMCALLTKV